MTQTSAIYAKEFINKLKLLASEKQKESYEKTLKKHAPADQFLGVPMGKVFALAKESMALDLSEIEKLLESDIHEARVGAVSIMDFQARDKKISADQKKALFDLYIQRHDRINTWDLVDRSAIWVVGSYLIDKDRSILYKLAKSKMQSERRTAILATAFFMRNGELEDTFKISEMLLKDEDELIHKAVGWMLRVAGDVDKAKLQEFLNKHISNISRASLRNAVEKFDKAEREVYLKT